MRPMKHTRQSEQPESETGQALAVRGPSAVLPEELGLSDPRVQLLPLVCKRCQAGNCEVCEGNVFVSAGRLAVCLHDCEEEL